MADEWGVVDFIDLDAPSVADTNLAAIRAGFTKELANPAIVGKLYDLTHNEVGSQGPEAQTAFMETVFNRAAARNMTLAQTINDREYYPAVSHRPAKRAPDAFKEVAQGVLSGSNISGYATGNASGTVGFNGGPQTFKAGGERFGIEGPDKGWVPTGKPVKVEALYDVETTPIHTLQTRRAKPVNPQDEPWTGIEFMEPEPPTMEQQTVEAPAEPEAPKMPLNQAMVEGVKRSLSKLGDDIFKVAYGDFTPIANMLIPNKHDFEAIWALTKPETYQQTVELGTPEHFEMITDNAIPLIGIGAAKLLQGGGRTGTQTPKVPEIQAAVDEVIGRRAKRPWDEVGLESGDIIEGEFVRMSDGTIGDRVSAMLTPAEGQRPARAILLQPGERVPPVLAGYPEIQHGDGTRTLFRPDEPAATKDTPEIEWYDENEMFPSVVEETPTQTELSQPTLSATQFDNKIEQMFREDQAAQAQELGGFAGTASPVASAIMDLGGMLSKAAAKRSGAYDKAPAMWDDVTKLPPAYNKIYSDEGIPPDRIASTLYEAGLIQSPDYGALRDALMQEVQSSQAISQAAKPKPVQTGMDFELPTIQDVDNGFKELGLSPEERLVLAGKHYVAVNPVTGEIKQLFPERDAALDYFQGEAEPGEALIMRKPGQPDTLVAKRPDSIASGEQLEIAKASKKLGREVKTGKDWDDLFAAEHQPFNLAGEAPAETGALTAEGAARAKAEAEYEQKKAQTTLDLGGKPAPKSKLKPFKGKKEAGAVGLGPLEPVAEAIKFQRQMAKFRDDAISKEGAVRNLSTVYAKQRGNVIRQDFGTIKDAMRKGTKAYRDLEALTAIEEAGRNKGTLAAHRKMVAASKNAAMRKKWTPVWDYALREFDRLSKVPDKFRDELNRQIAWEAYRGVDMGFTPNYVPHLFEGAPKNFMFGGWFKMGAGGSSLPRWFTKTRSYNSLAEAIHNGENPRSMNAADLAEGRIRAGKRLVLGKDYQAALKRYPMPDKRPALSEKEMHGYKPIEVYGTKVWAHPDAANFLDVLFDASAMRKSGIGRAVLKTAAVQKQVQLAADTFHAVRLSAYLAGAGKGVTRLPRSGYRRGVAVLELSPEQYAQAIKSGEYSPAEVKYAQDNRPLMLELLAQGSEVSKWADNLSQQMHAIVPGTKRLNSFIFDSLGRGALMTATIENFKRNLARFPEKGRTWAARKTVIEMNEQFGNPGRKIFRNKTFQDMMQTLMLAPNWVLTQALNEGRAYAQMAGYPVNVIEGLARGQGMKSFTRLGTTAQSRLALAAGLLVLAEVLNLAFNGETMDKNPEGHKFHAKIPAGMMGFEKDYYFDPAQIPFEFTHQIMKYLRKGEGALGSAAHILDNKLSKLARTGRGVWQYATTGQVRTYRGGPTAKTGPEATRLLAAEMLPAPIFSGGVIEPEPRSNLLFRTTRKPDAMAIQAAASAGVKLEPEETARQKMYVKAQEFKKPEDSGIPIQGKYSELKHALENRDQASVENEMSIIMKAAPTRAERSKMFDNIRKSLGISPTGRANQTYFTHSKERESTFIRSLKPEERSEYLQAQREHQNMVRFYLIMEPRLKRTLIFRQ